MKLKKMPLKKYYKYTVFVDWTFEDWMWNYCNIKVYLKTLMLGGINRFVLEKCVHFC